MSYVAVAPLVLVPDVDGAVRYVYQGQPLPHVNQADAERLLADGAIARVDVAPEPAPEDDPSGDDESGDDEPGDNATDERPANTAPKPAWIAYAISNGFDPAQAEEMNKADLIAALS